jgi:hypothetical protein
VRLNPAAYGARNFRRQHRRNGAMLALFEEPLPALKRLSQQGQQEAASVESWKAVIRRMKWRDGVAPKPDCLPGCQQAQRTTLSHHSVAGNDGSVH